MRWHVFVVSMLIGSLLGFGQEVSRDSTSATIGGTKITIEYGRPALKGRSFDALMKQLPPDRMWRAGSGMVTLLKTERPISIGGKKVPAGKYSLYVHCPENGSYALVINKDLGQPLGKIWSEAPADQKDDPYPSFAYKKEIAGKEVARIPMKKVKAPATDVFTIKIKSAGENAVMLMSWGERSWSLDITAAK
jgi:hypothetical protein